MKTTASTRFNIECILYDPKGNILARGKNSYTKTHTLQALYAEMVGVPDRKYLHAEIHALTKTRYKSSPVAARILRQNRGGATLMARPCAACFKALKDFGVREIEYTNNNGGWTSETIY